MNCKLCCRLLDQPNDPDSRNCGGDCWGCVREIEEEGGYSPDSIEKLEDRWDQWRHDQDPHADLVGYEFGGDNYDGERWRVTRTWSVIPSYVVVVSLATDEVSVRVAAQVRQAKLLTA